MRRLYRRYGFDEVITPLIFKNEMFNTSGHWENFRENMFLTPDPESETHTVDTSPEGWRHGYGVKPMNCPGHTFVYRAEKRSYRDLPLRFAEFSRLHRAERSGTLHGLMRVRAMSQDDAHIFCREDQIEDEVDDESPDGARRLQCARLRAASSSSSRPCPISIWAPKSNGRCPRASSPTR